MLVGSVHFNSKQKDTWDIADTISFNDCLKVLFALNQITRVELDELSEFNSLRNKIVHQIYKEPYEVVHPGVPKSEYDKVFQRTLYQVDFFTRKTEEIIE